MWGEHVLEDMSLKWLQDISLNDLFCYNKNKILLVFAQSFEDQVLLGLQYTRDYVDLAINTKERWG